MAGLGLVVAAVVLWATGAGSNPAPVAVPSTVTASPEPIAQPTPRAEVPSAEPAPPLRVRVPAITVEAEIVAVGVDGRGEMAVPEDVRSVGWYRFGPGPGASEGSSVLSGHVDDRLQGRGAFFSLGDLAVGETVEVELADGTSLRYVVRAVEVLDKNELPVDVLFDRAGPPRLTLVTCGGEFDRAANIYRANVVVTADPVVD
jgi:LPXTG-site transpeptidase (sortase) family protein